jgi:hypothetical protein
MTAALPHLGEVKPKCRVIPFKFAIKMPSPRLLFPLTPLKPTGIKTPPPPVASPPLHHHPGPIKCAPTPGQLHCAHPRSPHFTSSPRVLRTSSAAAELRSPPPLARLTAPLPEVSPPLGSPCRPLASRASTTSCRAPERQLGQASVNSDRRPL